MRSNFIRRNRGALTLRNQVRTSDLRLPLEGGATSIAPTAPHPSRAAARATFPQGKAIFAPRRNFSRGMTATGSHVHFYSLRGAQPPGEGYFSVPAVPTSIYTDQMPQDSGRGVPPPLPCHAGDLRFSSKNHQRPREKSRGRWLQKERGKL